MFDVVFNCVVCILFEVFFVSLTLVVWLYLNGCFDCLDCGVWLLDVDWFACYAVRLLIRYAFVIWFCYLVSLVFGVLGWAAWVLYWWWYYGCIIWWCCLFVVWLLICVCCCWRLMLTRFSGWLFGVLIVLFNFVWFLRFLLFSWGFVVWLFIVLLDLVD